jgi:hypothetical protein
MLRASVMVARWAHNPEGRFDSVATHPRIIAGRQDKGRPAAFQAEDRGVRLSLPAPTTRKILCSNV